MPTLDVTQASVILGILCTLIVLIITVARQKRFDLNDLGSFIGAFFSGSNLPPAAFLCYFIFKKDTHLEMTSLKGYEKYISLAGLVLFLASVIAVWKLCKTAWEISEAETPATAPPTTPQSSPASSSSGQAD